MTRVELIAEVASNHGGDLSLAKEFIWRCAEAGADWVKFQTTRVRHLRPDDPQFAWFQRAELSDEAHLELKAECESAGVRFLTTVYHPADVPFVASLGLDAIKIGSGEAMEVALAEAVMVPNRQASRVLVSLGLCRNNPWESAFIRDRWSLVEFLGTVTRYPAPQGVAVQVLSAWRLAGVTTSGPRYSITGWSDHANGLSECQVAICAGATIIEKHVQLPNQARPWQPWEATMAELKALRAFADESPEAKYLGRWQYAKHAKSAEVA